MLHNICEKNILITEEVAIHQDVQLVLKMESEEGGIFLVSQKRKFHKMLALQRRWEVTSYDRYARAYPLFSVSDLGDAGSFFTTNTKGWQYALSLARVTG